MKTTGWTEDTRTTISTESGQLLKKWGCKVTWHFHYEQSDLSQQSACMYFFHNAFSSFSLTELFFSWIWEHVALKSNREEVWSVKVVSSIIITTLSPVTFNVKIVRLDTSSSTAISYGVRLLILVLLMRSVCTPLHSREVVINWTQPGPKSLDWS